MTKRPDNTGWLARLRTLVPWSRTRHYADVSALNAQPAPKLEPIEKIVSTVGRNPTSPVD